jgi:hypothetical protein
MGAENGLSLCKPLFFVVLQPTCTPKTPLPAGPETQNDKIIQEIFLS